MSPHIVLTTYGSLGDLHPYLAVGIRLRERGATVTVATSEIYRDIVVREGLGFRAIRPDAQAFIDNPELISRALHPRTGGRYIVDKLLLPHLEESFDDLLPLVREADLLVSHPITFATPIAADLAGKPWISVILQPAALISAYDLPSVAAAPFLDRFRGLRPAIWRTLIRLGLKVIRRAGEPINAFRTRVGVHRVRNPILDGMFSPHGKQAWFSRVMAKPQPDWPAALEITGYPFFDETQQQLSAALLRFLDAGPPPVVFTMGSAAVFDAGSFYQVSAEAAERAGCRAVLLVGRDPRNLPDRALPDTIFTAEYAPFAGLFPRAAAIVHQGGIGTTSQGLRSGHPMIIVPYSHDQPDNARRVANLGAGRIIRRKEYKPKLAAEALQDLLGSARYSTAAREAAAAVRSEDGAGTAADSLLKMAARKGTGQRISV